MKNKKSQAVSKEQKRNKEHPKTERMGKILSSSVPDGKWLPVVCRAVNLH
jgi:hypothetical protein